MLFSSYTEFLKDVVSYSEPIICQSCQRSSDIWKVVQGLLGKGWSAYKEAGTCFRFVIKNPVILFFDRYLQQIHVRELREILDKYGFSEREKRTFIEESWLPFAVLKVGKRYEASFGANKNNDEYIVQLFDEAIKMLTKECNSV